MASDRPPPGFAPIVVERPGPGAGGAGLGRSPALGMLALLVAARIAVVLAAVQSGSFTEGALSDDVLRYQEILESPGRPYADFAVEYAPVSLLAILAFGGDTARTTGSNLAWVMLGADLLSAGAVWYGWGCRAAAGFLVLGLPLLVFLYFRLDPLPVALAVSALAAVRRGQNRAGGALLALAVLAKVWPLVLLPALLVSRRWRALGWFAAVLAIGVGLWVAWGGTSAPRQVLTFRGATGWEVESTVGWFLWVGGARVRVEAGAPRVGTGPLWAQAVLLVALVGIVAATWVLWRDRRPQGLGLAALVSVAALLVLAPILSPQYLAWLVPWAAISWANGEGRDRLPAVLTLLAVSLTGALFVAYSHGLPSRAPVVAQVGVLARNGLLMGVVGVGLWRLSSARPHTDQRVALRTS